MFFEKPNGKRVFMDTGNARGRGAKLPAVEKRALEGSSEPASDAPAAIELIAEPITLGGVERVLRGGLEDLEGRMVSGPIAELKKANSTLEQRVLRVAALVDEVPDATARIRANLQHHPTLMDRMLHINGEFSAVKESLKALAAKLDARKMSSLQWLVSEVLVPFGIVGMFAIVLATISDLRTENSQLRVDLKYVSEYVSQQKDKAAAEEAKRLAAEREKFQQEKKDQITKYNECASKAESPEKFRACGNEGVPPDVKSSGNMQARISGTLP